MCVLGAQGDERELSSYEVPIAFKAGLLPQDNDALQVQVRTPSARELAAQLTRTTVTVDKVKRRSLNVTLRGADTVTGEPQARHRAATYLIDYEEPAMVTLSATLAAELSDRAGVARMIDFVHDRMKQTSYMRSFDIASVVAASQTGDCTEHALLLTGLARAQGYPARVIIGSLVLSSPDRSGAYGHAWSEIWVNGKWQIADATLPSEGPGFPIHYLPVAEVDNEGMGYMMTLAGITKLMPAAFDRARVAR